MMSSQRYISDVQAIELDLADDSGIKVKASYELMSRHSGGKSSVGYTLTDQKNYLRKRRQREMKYGEAGTLLRWTREAKNDIVQDVKGKVVHEDANLSATQREWTTIIKYCQIFIEAKPIEIIKLWFCFKVVNVPCHCDALDCCDSFMVCHVAPVEQPLFLQVTVMTGIARISLFLTYCCSKGSLLAEAGAFCTEFMAEFVMF
ncbi:protein FAR1-RELATED SEQUENCE 5 [Artemisia annua]|uniref:Protein FAR1-RELATED SEQUENCE 5 n=1 Tax=Artemisia annua TaxID=35608 RepID=A0A2U1PDT1_ARTAN|nr:protein FAR1-RELATED SEQUENCE 5 [Artemisia annua]